MDKKKLLIIVAVVLLFVVLLSLGSGGKKGVAMDFAEAMFSDLNAKKAVSLMSEEYLEENMDRMGAATKKVYISELKQNNAIQKEDLEDHYGRHWKVKIDYIDGYKNNDGRYCVVLNVTHEGTGGLLDLKDLEDTREYTVALVKEGGKWRVDDIYS